MGGGIIQILRELSTNCINWMHRGQQLLHEIGQIVEKSIFNDAFLHKTAVFMDKLFQQAPAMVCKPSGRPCTSLAEWSAVVFADHGAV